MFPDLGPNPGQEPPQSANPEVIAKFFLILHLSYSEKINVTSLTAKMQQNDHELLAAQCARGAIAYASAKPLDEFNEAMNAYVLGASLAYDYHTTIIKRNGLPMPNIDENTLKTVEDENERAKRTNEGLRTTLSEDQYRKFIQETLRDRFKELGPALVYAVNKHDGPTAGKNKGAAFINGALYVTNVFGV